MKSEIIDTSSGKQLTYYCPGCNCRHRVAVSLKPNAEGPVWSWNGKLDAPTLSPSVAVTHFPEGVQVYCHAYVQEGRIQYLNDSTHELNGQVVEMPDLPPLTPMNAV